MNYELLGRLTLVLFALAALFLGVLVCGLILDGVLEKWRDRVRRNAVREFGNRVATVSWWFDDRAARTALKVLAAEMTQNANFNNDQLREAWRKEMAQETTKAQASR